MGKFNIAEHLIRAAGDAISKRPLPQDIEQKFKNNNVPGLAKLQVAILIINRTSVTMRRSYATLDSGEWNSANPYILTAPERINSNEGRWIVAETNSLIGDIKGKIHYWVKGWRGEELSRWSFATRRCQTTNMYTRLQWVETLRLLLTEGLEAERTLPSLLNISRVLGFQGELGSKFCVETI